MNIDINGLVTQSSLAPTRKVSAAGIWGLITVLAFAAIDYYAPGMSLNPMVSSAVTGAVAWLAAYFTKERAA